MCVWVPIALAAVSVIQSINQNNLQKKQADMQQQAVEAGREAQLAALRTQEQQINEQASEDASVRARQAVIERGRLASIAADSGLGGRGAAMLENDSKFRQGYDISTIQVNRDRMIAENHAQRGVAIAGGDAKLASITRPSMIGTGLQIAGNVLNVQSKRPPGGTTTPNTTTTADQPNLITDGVDTTSALS
jgi:hypothetical protein